MTVTLDNEGHVLVGETIFDEIREFEIPILVENLWLSLINVLFLLEFYGQMHF